MEDLPLGRIAVLVPEFAVKDLPLGRIAVLVPEFAVKDLSLGRTPMMKPEIEPGTSWMAVRRANHYTKQAVDLSTIRNAELFYKLRIVKKKNANPLNRTRELLQSLI